MKRGFLFLILSMLLCSIAGEALAGGFYDILIAVDGKGASVYSSSRAEKQAGILYNAYWDYQVDYRREENGWFPLRLTEDYTVWVHEKTAMKNQPAQDPDWMKEASSGVFLGKIIQDNVPFYTRPDADEAPVARYQNGTLMKVWGEFGQYYFVNASGQNYLSNTPTAGFVPRNAVERVRDLDFEEANYRGLPALEERTVSVGEGLIVPCSDSMTGWSQIVRGTLRDGDTVSIAGYPADGWAQLTSGSFIETRFLTDNAEHSWYNWAVVKTSSVLNRLNVRYSARSNAVSTAKLCAGVGVQVVSRTEDWAVICLSGTENSDVVIGCVMIKFLAFGDSTVVKSGKTDAVISRDTGQRHVIPAGEQVTVFGVRDGFDTDRDDDADSFLVRTASGRLLWIRNEEGLIQPVGSSGIKVKTSSSVKMRQLPLKNADVLQSLDKGTKVEVLLRGEGWTMVKYRDQTGYIMSRYLVFP